MAECAPRFAAARGAGSPGMLAVCPPRPSSPRCRPAAALAGLDAVPAYRKSPSVPRPASRSLVAGVFSLLTCTRIFLPQCLCVSSSVPRVPAEGVPSDFIRAEHQTKSRFVAVPPSSQLTVLGRPHAALGPSGLGRWSVG